MLHVLIHPDGSIWTVDVVESSGSLSLGMAASRLRNPIQEQSGSIDDNQQPTNGGARAPPRNAGLAGLDFTGAAPDGIPVLADNSTDAAINKCIGAAHGGCSYGERAGRGDVGTARRADCFGPTGSTN